MPTTTDNRLLARAIIASQVAPPFMFSGVAVALPGIDADLHAGATQLGLVETMFLAGSLAFLLPVGRLSDAWDKRTLYKFGLLAFGLASIIIGSLSWMPAILMLRFLQGVASAAISTTGPALLADLVPPEQRGRAYGGALGAAYVGLMLGPITAGQLIERWGWRAVFLFGAMVLVLGFLLIHVMLRRYVAPRMLAGDGGAAEPGARKAIHLPSAVVIVFAVLYFVAGSAALRHGTIGGLLFLAGGVLAVVFLIMQTRVENPLLDLRALLDNRELRNALLIQLLLYFSAYCTIFMLSMYMQVSLEQSARTSGIVLAAGTMLMAIMAPIAGRLADRYPPRIIATLGVFSVLTTTLLGTMLDGHTRLRFVTVMVALQGLGFSFFSSPNMSIIMKSVATNATGMASALAAKARSLGIMAGMLIPTLLMSRRIGSDPVERHPVEFIGIVTTAFAILAGTTALSLVLCIISGKRRHDAKLDA